MEHHSNRTRFSVHSNSHFVLEALKLFCDIADICRAGNLPPAYPPEAATPRMQDVAAAILRSLAELEESTKSKTSPKPKFSGNHPASCRNPTQPSEPTPTTWKNDTSPAERRNGVRKTEAQQQMLLDEHMEKQQAQEEAYLELLQDQIDRPVNFAYDEAAGPVASSHVLPYEKRYSPFPKACSCFPVASQCVGLESVDSCRCKLHAMYIYKHVCTFTHMFVYLCCF